MEGYFLIIKSDAWLYLEVLNLCNRLMVLGQNITRTSSKCGHSFLRMPSAFFCDVIQPKTYFIHSHAIPKPFILSWNTKDDLILKNVHAAHLHKVTK